MNRFFIVIIALAAICSCHPNPLKVNVSDIEISLNMKSYDDDLFAASGNLQQAIPYLQKKYGNFFNLYNQEMIRINNPEDDDFYQQLNDFLTDTMIIELKKKADQLIDKKQLEADFTRAFKYYRYYFPKQLIPSIYTCISGFNQSIILADSLIGISLDNYLGADCRYYPRLGIPSYKLRNMHPKKIVSDVMYFWAFSEFPINPKAYKLIEHMIYQGCLLYFVDAMIPDGHDTLKIGYTGKQLDFCLNREQGMWTYLVENNLLFSTKRMDIKRYVDDSPYTAGFTTESPGLV